MTTATKSWTGTEGVGVVDSIPDELDWEDARAIAEREAARPAPTIRVKPEIVADAWQELVIERGEDANRILAMTVQEFLEEYLTS